MIAAECGQVPADAANSARQINGLIAKLLAGSEFLASIVSAVLSIIVGVLFLRRPEEAVVTLALLLIVFFMVEGFAKIVFSLTIRPLPNWGWVLASGIVGILLSFYLLANLTTTAVWLLGVLLGIQLICEGVALSSLAWRVRRSA